MNENVLESDFEPLCENILSLCFDSTAALLHYLLLIYTQKPPPRILPDSDESLSTRQQVSPCSWMAEPCCRWMLSFSHVSVKTNTQESLVSCCVDRLSLIKSSLFSRERTFECMSDGIAGLVELALSLAHISPLLLHFCPLWHRRRRCFVRVASVDEAAVLGFGFGSRQRPCSFSVVKKAGWRFKVLYYFLHNFAINSF